MTPGAARIDATIYSISVEWDIVGDSNHNAASSVNYRPHGTTPWLPALPLVRVDFNGANALAGSILFLTPGTTYDVQLSLTDPDGGAAQRTLSVSTRPLPTLAASGRTLHVVPGTGGGDGSPGDPFRGVAAADAAAAPGDTILLHKGDYGARVTLATPGTPAAFVAWKAYGDGEVLVRGVDVQASHVWLEGVTVRSQTYGLRAFANPENVVVRRCGFYNNHYAIVLVEGGRRWYIADNTIVGDTPYNTGDFDGEGIELNMTGGHTVAHNSISSVADGISDPGPNTDVFGNDVFDTSDDGLELDTGGANVRIWGNRIHNAVHNGISFQPQAGAPWYIVRNQIVGNAEAAFKFRTTDRFVLLHNTIVNWGTAWNGFDRPGDAMMCCNEDHLLRAISRNNVWVSIVGGQIWGFDAGVIDWRTDLDYDAIDWGSASNPFAYGGVTYPDLASMSAATGLEPHGVRVQKDSCYSLDVPNPPPAPVPPQIIVPRAGCPAVDAGVVLPNINAGDFAGVGPDIGAVESGRPLPQFGPRSGPTARLTISPSALASGESATLAWTTTDAATVTLDALGGVASSGVATVVPTETTTYTLIATGTEGVATATATIVVEPRPPSQSTPFSGVPVHVPGTIEAENFDEGGAEVAYHDDSAGNSGGAFRNTDVDVEITTDTGGGFNIGWVAPGEWLAYTVDVPAAGAYTIDVRVASTALDGAFHIDAGGTDKTGQIPVPNTGGWQAWTTVTVTNVRLNAGVQIFRLVMDRAAANGAVGNFNWIRVIGPSSGGPTPYNGTPVTLPGAFEAEEFDDGGAEAAYHDLSSGNSGGAFRGSDVDIEVSADPNAGMTPAMNYNVGWVDAGEWLNYTANVVVSGRYTIAVRVASTGTGGTFHIDVNGTNKTGPLVIPNTGGWQTWTTVTATDVLLDAGIQTFRLTMDRVATSGAVGNFNWVRVSPSTGSTPYGGTAVVLPGTVQAEYFDTGGGDIAYHDDSAGNSGGALRATDVDIEATSSGGYNVGWVSAGEWLNYTVSVATAAAYVIEFRVASPGVGGRFHLEVNGLDKTGAVSIPDTGGWQSWTTVAVSGVPLAAGTQVLRLVMDKVATSGAVGNFDWIRLQPDDSGPFAITAPSTGSTLRTTSMTVRWVGGGDEFWVNVGTTPGGDDVYASGSIGQGAEQTVTGLPLNGTTVYVEVRRSISGRIDTTSAQYTAAVRRGLAIVTDFSDRNLEDWTGAGMKSLADVSAQLRALEGHWAWLSRGREKIQWDTIRIRLPQAAVPGAFADWNAFRDAVARLARQQVDIADYDVNSDGVLDLSWAIVCSGDADVGGYAVGGSSKNAGVNMFVDGQASQSVRQGQTGNFTHEVGHLLGIVDMYGDYATQGPLTIMSYPWVNPGQPPGDFAAYEQQLLGWLVPRVVNETTHDVWLPNAFDQIAAVKIPTARDSEYFLIEYRRKPQTGYGSAHFNMLDGLVVYHVLEGASMSQDPPLVKLEPADGRINPGDWPDPGTDLIYPGNPSWGLPLVMYSYDRVPQEVFRLDNVAWVGGGMRFDLTVMPLQPALNLLANASFESGDGGRPSSWMTGASLDETHGFVWPGSAALSGVASTQIAASLADDKYWSQSVNTVIGEPYKLCGWLKGESITGGSVGANVSVLGGYVRSNVRMGTFDWSQSCTTFTAAALQVAVACRLGFYGDMAAGTMWCDDMRLEPFRPRSAF